MLVCWRPVIAAWAVVFVLLVVGFAAVDLTFSIGEAEATPVTTRGVKVPQYGSFNLGPPAFQDDLARDPAAAEVDD
jgi:hypothetical protein